jgi:hypothetical protein
LKLWQRAIDSIPIPDHADKPLGTLELAGMHSPPYLGPFTDDEAALIRRLAARGVTQERIADRIGADMAAIREFCDRNALRLSEREALPAGHSLTWEPLLSGSCIAGAPFKSAGEVQRE